MKEKIKEEKSFAGSLKTSRTEGKRIVFTNGCFDLLHVGHVRYLEEAKALGDILVVGINSDSSVREAEGAPAAHPPTQGKGAEILSGLECVDYVTLFDEPTPLELISLLQPHVLVKGGDWTKETIVGKEVVEELGRRGGHPSFCQGRLQPPTSSRPF